MANVVVVAAAGDDIVGPQSTAAAVGDSVDGMAVAAAGVGELLLHRPRNDCPGSCSYRPAAAAAAVGNRMALDSWQRAQTRGRPQTNAGPRSVRDCPGAELQTKTD